MGTLGFSPSVSSHTLCGESMIETLSPLYTIALQYRITEEQLQNLISAYQEEKLFEPTSFGDLLEVLE
jgi:hypothetical protein